MGLVLGQKNYTSKIVFCFAIVQSTKKLVISKLSFAQEAVFRKEFPEISQRFCR